MTSKRILGSLGLGVLAVAFSLSIALVSDAAEPVLKSTATISTASPTPAVVLASCAAGAANATIDLTTAAPTGESTSPDANYVNVGCKRYVVDVKLPANMSQYFVQQMWAGDITSQDTQAKCEAVQTTIYFYRKAAGQIAFTASGGGTARGVWNSNPGFGQFSCTMKNITGATDRSNTAQGGDVWRIAVGSAEHSLPVRVKVAATIMQTPK